VSSPIKLITTATITIIIIIISVIFLVVMAGTNNTLAFSIAAFWMMRIKQKRKIVCGNWCGWWRFNRASSTSCFGYGWLWCWYRER
jgi:hypothetical protein